MTHFSTMREEEEIIIVGGGICGLATALALHRKGLRSMVLERTSELRASGAGIRILDNGWRALHQLGVASLLRKSASLHFWEREINLDKGLNKQTKLKCGESRCLRRSDLINALANALPPGTIHYECQVVNIKSDSSSSCSVIQLLDGRSIMAKVLIGCDGSKSVVAEFLNLSTVKEFGLMEVRGLTNYPNGHPFSGEFRRIMKNNILVGEIPIDDMNIYWFVTQQSSRYNGDKLGLPPPAPYAAPGTTGTRILGGVNYASAAAGILDETGRHYGERYTLSQQVINFENTLGQLRTLLPGDNLNQYLSKSLVVMVFGSNDYINNYLMPTMYTSSYNYNPVDYANLLLNHYARQLVALYSVGLRKFMLAGIGPLGCIPNQLATGQAPPGRCVDNVNQILGTFNQGLRSLVAALNNGTHPGAIFTYGNTYGVFGDILNNPPAFGFTVRDRGCCGSGRNQGQITCMPFQMPCINRNQFVFWDAFHPTQAANAILAQRAYAGPPNDCYPINVQQMSLLN